MAGPAKTTSNKSTGNKPTGNKPTLSAKKAKGVAKPSSASFPGPVAASPATTGTVDPSSTGRAASAPETTTVAPAPTTTALRSAAAAMDRMVVDGEGDDTSGAPATEPHAPSTERAAPTDEPTEPDFFNKPATLGDVAQANQGVGAYLARQLQQAFEVSLSPQAASMHAPTSASKLSTRDVKLPDFSGSKDADAMHIDPDMYLPLLEWVREARVLLRASGLPATQQVFAVFNALKGPACHN